MGLSNEKASPAEDGEGRSLKGDVEAGALEAPVAPDGEGGVGEGADAAPAEAPPADAPLTLILLGRVGVGKSSTANTILGAALAEPFVARRSAAAVTASCRAATGELQERKVLVLDTPGLGDAATPDSEIHAEILRGFAELVPKGAPACLVLVFSLNGRVGEDELATVSALEQRVFGRGMLATSLVLWTHADLLDDGGGVEDYLAGADERLRVLLARAGGGSVAWDNRRSGAQAAGGQLTALLAQAEAVARPLQPCPQETRHFGRRTARRRRQLEAGLLRAPPEQRSGGCCLA